MARLGDMFASLLYIYIHGMISCAMISIYWGDMGISDIHMLPFMIALFLWPLTILIIIDDIKNVDTASINEYK